MHVCVSVVNATNEVINYAEMRLVLLIVSDLSGRPPTDLKVFRLEKGAYLLSTSRVAAQTIALNRSLTCEGNYFDKEARVDSR